MILNVDTTPDKYFRQLIEILKIIPPFTDLRKRERDVFAELLYYNHKFSKMDKEVAKRLLFDQTTKEEISVKLGISKGNLYNIFKELRQGGFIVEDEIDKKYNYEYMQPPEVIFKFQDKSGVQ